jgi:type I restriction enzyme R subunit
VNSRILYEQMIGRATRQCPDIRKEVFRIFDAVDLYPHLQNLTDMKPVVVNPSISFEQLVGEMIEATDDAQRDTIREQLAVKLRRRLKKLLEEARQRFEAVAGETPEAMLQRLLSGNVPDLAAWLRDRTAIGPILDWQLDGDNPRYVPISHHDDEVVAVTRGYGEAQKPEDFLDSFSAFVRDNINAIAALKLVVQRPRDLTRADLKELRLALDRKGYSEANLRRAWTDAKNEEIAASIIGFVRQAAIGDPLVPYEERVTTAVRSILVSRQWSEPQRKWLERIGRQMVLGVVLDRTSFDEQPFAGLGGHGRINKVLGGQLDAILGELQERIWESVA